VKAWLPAKFWLDHVERECVPRPRSVRRLGDRIEVEGSLAEFEQVLSDARYYADPVDFDPEYRPLCASAARAVRVLERAVADQPPPEE